MVISLLCLFVDIKRLYFHMYRNSTDFSQNMGENISKSNRFFRYHLEIFKFLYRIISIRIKSKSNRILSVFCINFSISTMLGAKYSKAPFAVHLMHHYLRPYTPPDINHTISHKSNKPQQLINN
jgi:predicted transcriptional regulator YheO